MEFDSLWNVLEFRCPLDLVCLMPLVFSTESGGGHSQTEHASEMLLKASCVRHIQTTKVKLKKIIQYGDTADILNATSL